MTRRISRESDPLLPLLLLALLPVSNWARAESTIGLSSDHYLHESSTLAQDNFSSLEAHLSAQTRRQWLEARVSFDAWALVQSHSPFNFEAPEAWVGIRTEGDSLSSTSLRLGRRLEPWSPLDDVWQLGIWQPRFRWDYFAPKSVGLTGAFGSVEVPGLRVLAFASPVSIPERGMPLAAENGQISSPLRFFVPPPADLTLAGASLPVRYNLAMPPVRELVVNPGAGALARVGGEKGAWGSVAYAFQPVAQPALSYDGYLSLAPDRGAEFEAMVVPRVVYHHLASLSGGWTEPRWSVWLSALAENPVDNETWDPALTHQVYTPARSICATWQYRNARSTGVLSSPTLTVSYLLQTGGNAPDEGPLADGATSLFDSRYPYSHAILLENISELTRRLSFSARVIYDIGHNGAIWSPQLSFSPYPAFAFNLGADLLSTGFGPDDGGADFISRNRVNSRVHSGVSYVF